MKYINWKTVFIILAAVALLISACSQQPPKMPEDLSSDVTAPENEDPAETAPDGIPELPDLADLPNFGSFTGTVKEVIAVDYAAPDGGPLMDSYVLVENDDGAIVNFVVMSDTYMITDSKLVPGAKVTGFYDAKAPMLMIYPPQYTAVAMAVDLPESVNIHVDRFDENLISADGMLKLNIADTTGIILQDGQPFDGDLTGRALIVLYGPSTRSIPAQTTPDKIVVLFEKAVPPVYELPPQEPEASNSSGQSSTVIIPR